ncbi:potassium channel family protein [Mariprofundus erugo]|uniref:potassium channel family protein n=1 Tax=Mariprofundus erugo TaxID=2528639 RepID=UPI0010FEAC99|nr:potassium channel family protein [Mariprofundus erugo]TLS76911.1 potassium channel family protein [Mariprofundus erugo]
MKYSVAETALTWRWGLNRMLFDLSSRGGRIVNMLIAGVILCSLLASMSHSVDWIEEEWKQELSLIETTSYLLFLLEYLLRIVSARYPLRYIFSFEGMVDAAAIFPMLLTGQNTGGVRLLRLLRLIKLLQHLNHLRMIMVSLNDISHSLLAVLSGIVVVSLTAGNLIYYFEPETFSSAFEGLWWSLVTMSTVGYGDIVPHTGMGRLIAGVLILVGISMFAMVTALISARIAYVQQQTENCDACNSAIEKHFLFCPVCGVNRSDRKCSKGGE